MSKDNFTKNGRYVKSLVDFILDTKPYHSKLTEIVEENLFYDNMQVKMDESLLFRSKLNSAWSYEFFSGGNSAFRQMQFHDTYFPLIESNFLKNTDSIGDLGGAKGVFNKQTTLDRKIVGASILRDNSKIDLHEGVDYFTTHGSYQFDILSAKIGDTYYPRWVPTNENNLISHLYAVNDSRSVEICAAIKSFLESEIAGLVLSQEAEDVYLQYVAFLDSGRPLSSYDNLIELLDIAEQEKTRIYREIENLTPPFCSLITPTS